VVGADVVHGGPAGVNIACMRYCTEFALSLEVDLASQLPLLGRLSVKNSSRPQADLTPGAAGKEP